MISIVILDDEPESLTALRAQVERLLPDSLSYHITEATGIEGITALLSQRRHIDLLITDIVMSQGQPSGIEVVRRLFPQGCGTQVMYVSGYLDQTLEVYPSNHFYFLLKPVDDVRLQEALDLALQAIERQRPVMLRIKEGHRERLINTALIAYLASDLRKVKIYCREAQYETYAKLDDLMPQLPSNFVRCHRSFVVNLSYVTTLELGTIYLHDGTVLPVSRRRTKEVQHALLTYISGRQQPR